jgi:ABC-type amino acid transport substrate-binding protein
MKHWLIARIVVVAAACSGFALSATAGVLDDIKARGRLSFGVYNDFAPFHDKGVGLEVDIANALAAQLGVRANLMPFDASDENIEDDLRNMVWKGHYLGWGPADVMLHVPVAAPLMDAVKQVRIFGPYHTARLAIAHDRSSIPVMDALSRLGATQKIGAEIASINSVLIGSAEGGKYQGNLQHFRTPAAALAALKSGQVSAVMATRAEVEAAVAGDKRFAVSPAPFPDNLRTTWAVGMAVKRSSEDLADALGKALVTLRDNGELARIFARHGVGYTAAEVAPTPPAK